MKLAFVCFCRCDVSSVHSTGTLSSLALFRVDSEHLFPSGVENYRGGPVDLFKSFVVCKNGESFP